MRSDPRSPTGSEAAGPDGDGPVVRRAPFSDNPHVGARGQRTQQRIVDAALEVFGAKGYHQTSIDRITKVAGCSRVSFYQYFSSKEDLFRFLAGQVARQLRASTEALGPIDAGPEGWATLRAWVDRHGDIYERYEAIFHAFQAAAEMDEAVAGGSARTTERNLERIRSRLATTALPPRRLDPVIALLLTTLTRTMETAGVLAAVAPQAYPPDRIRTALTDVVHRTLFGRDPAVNEHPGPRRRPPALTAGPAFQELFRTDGLREDLSPAGRETLEALVQAGREAFVARGYHRTRVDDVVAAAGVSHGAFYRYFRNKDELAHLVAVRAMVGVSSAFLEIPPRPDDGAEEHYTSALRAWLRRYHAVRSAETSAIRVWVDVTRQDPALRGDAAAVVDGGRRQMARFLHPRRFGDGDAEAVVMIGLLSAFGARPRDTADIEATAYVIERGLLGRPGT